MPISIATAAQARRNFVDNPANRWHKQGALVTEPNGLLAFQRLRQSPFIPHILPRFRVSRQDNVFAIGSCFARGVESALVTQGMQVLSRTTEFDSFPRNRNEAPLTFLNKYNIFAICSELSGALDPAAVFPRDSVVPVGDNLVYDPHSNAALAIAMNFA
jgi:GSCFA family